MIGIAAICNVSFWVSFYKNRSLFRQAETFLGCLISSLWGMVHRANQYRNLFRHHSLSGCGFETYICLVDILCYTLFRKYVYQNLLQLAKLNVCDNGLFWYVKLCHSQHILWVIPEKIIIISNKAYNSSIFNMCLVCWLIFSLCLQCMMTHHRKAIHFSWRTKQKYTKTFNIDFIFSVSRCVGVNALFTAKKIFL